MAGLRLSRWLAIGSRSILTFGPKDEFPGDLRIGAGCVLMQQLLSVCDEPATGYMKKVQASNGRAQIPARRAPDEPSGPEAAVL